MRGDIAVNGAGLKLDGVNLQVLPNSCRSLYRWHGLDALLLNKEQTTELGISGSLN